MTQANSLISPLFGSQDLEGNQIETLASMLKASGDALRVQILQALKSDAFGVLELTQIFETKQSGMSHHLKVLSTAGLVEAQREGNAIFYRRPLGQDNSLRSLIRNQLFETLDKLAIAPKLSKQMRKVREQRAQQSMIFFERNSEKFAEQQELICDHEQYAEASFALLKGARAGYDSVLEIGPGEGFFLKSLSGLYERVSAVDTSESMLQKSKGFCQQHGLKNVELIHGDSSTLVEQGDRFDAVVMNMVLHHVPTPAEIFDDCAKLLDAGGALVISDLSHHNQSWTRENCGDLWLGFEPEELKSWAERSGFEEDESIFIGLRNGFQIQIHRFIRS